MSYLITKSCNTPLVASIRSHSQASIPSDLIGSTLFDILGKVTLTISSSNNRHPVPFGTVITDHIQRNMDTLVMTGIVGCDNCAVKSSFKFKSIINIIKLIQSKMVYEPSSLIQITSNEWQFNYAILLNATIEEDAKHPQVKTITTTWVGANFSGSLSSPTFSRGGLSPLVLT